MKITILILALISALIFGTIYLKPAADPNHSPKAWAHGVGYVFPRIVGTLSFAGVAALLISIAVMKNGGKATFTNCVIIIAMLSLLPAVYTLLFVIRVLIEVHLGT